MLASDSDHWHIRHACAGRSAAVCVAVSQTDSLKDSTHALGLVQKSSFKQLDRDLASGVEQSGALLGYVSNTGRACLQWPQLAHHGHMYRHWQKMAGHGQQTIKNYVPCTFLGSEFLLGLACCCDAGAAHRWSLVLPQAAWVQQHLRDSAAPVGQYVSTEVPVRCCHVVFFCCCCHSAFMFVPCI